MVKGVIGKRYRRIEPESDPFDLVELVGFDHDQNLIVRPMSFGSNYTADPAVFAESYTANGVKQSEAVAARESDEAWLDYQEELQRRREEEAAARLAEADISNYTEFINE